MIYKKRDNFWLYHQACIDEDVESSLTKKIWIPIGQKHEQKSGVMVEEGDVFKFGKKNFKINKICNLLRKEKKPTLKPKLVLVDKSSLFINTTVI
jgi:hypothetical protein